MENARVVGAPGPAFSTSKAMSNDAPNDHECTVTTDSCIRYYDTGAGYLVFKVRFEYHPDHDRWFPIDHELIGASEVKDWSRVIESLEGLGLNQQEVTHLPKYRISECPSEKGCS